LHGRAGQAHHLEELGDQAVEHHVLTTDLHVLDLGASHRNSRPPERSLCRALPSDSTAHALQLTCRMPVGRGRMPSCVASPAQIGLIVARLSPAHDASRRASRRLSFGSRWPAHSSKVFRSAQRASMSAGKIEIGFQRPPGPSNRSGVSASIYRARTAALGAPPPSPRSVGVFASAAESSRRCARCTAHRLDSVCARRVLRLASVRRVQRVASPVMQDANAAAPSTHLDH
jgi:hypothetical protein